ncbi:MAG TPA: TlpA disulfide reductase family protein [Ilumatobacteraceae bacterium]|nr:TlpA disulfide reductase family protein [Ilumatobacteraceae bacterium]
MTTSANRRAEMRRKQTQHQGEASRSMLWWIVGGVLLAVILSAVVAIATNKDDEVVEIPANYEQNRPVAVSGTSLPGIPQGGGPDPALGMTAPIVTGQSFDGSPVTTAGNGPRMIVVVAHWCPHCRNEVPRLVQWQQSGQMPAGLDVVFVSTSVQSNAPNYPPSRWLEDVEHVTWPTLADDVAQTAAAALGTSGFPYFLVVDANGTVVLRDSGEQDTASLTARIEAALG